jgi:hypothetical protein
LVTTAELSMMLAESNEKVPPEPLSFWLIVSAWP